MKNIEGDDRTVEALLSGAAFGIDYYQREYKWGRKQLQELVDDLFGQFDQSFREGQSNARLTDQSKYFLGSIVISKNGDIRNIVDGQQRITTLTLLLIFLNNLQRDFLDPVKKVETLVYDEDPDGHKFKLDIPERNECMAALLRGDSYNPDGHSDSVNNLVERYNDLSEVFPTDVSETKLKMFIWWIMRNVKLIEIVAQDDGDAYTIFETMNDRGLSLTPTDMLKGYLLANIDNPAKRFEANNLIKKYLGLFSEHGKEVEAEFFKAWIRSQYAKKIRERKKHAKPEDFDLIGTEYHRWVRSHATELGLVDGNAVYQFVTRDLRLFAEVYLQLLKASKTRVKGLESVRYNADAGFTLQHHVTLSTIDPEDDTNTITEKIGVAADFLDCWLNLRLWNYKSNSYSSMQYSVFTIIRDIRGKPLSELRTILRDRLVDEMSEIDFTAPVGLNQFTSKAIHRQLARFTDWLEQQSGEPGKYEDYIIRSGKNAYEVEHIWANHYDRFSDEFDQLTDFDQHRNRIGGLLLLPKKINASLSDMTYEEKQPHYLKSNPLAQSLHSDFYKSNPGFKQTIEKFDLPFHAHKTFAKEDLIARSNLYCRLAEIIWSPNRLLNHSETE